MRARTLRVMHMQMLRELLTESRDFGTLLGGGSGPGGPPGGALRAYVPDAQERKQLFEAVAYECQVRTSGVRVAYECQVRMSARCVRVPGAYECQVRRRSRVHVRGALGSNLREWG